MTTFMEFKIPSNPSPMPTLGSDDEESFVVIGKSLIPDVDISFNNLHVDPIQSGPIEDGKRLINMELSKLETSAFQTLPILQQKNDQGAMIGVTSISSELSPEEVQEKVDILIAENIKLRETIVKNNAAMESQHNRIVTWKEEVQKTHQAHVQKFNEAKEFICKLKAEKELLRLELEKSNEIQIMQQNELFKLKDELKQKETTERTTDTQGSSLTCDKGSQLGEEKVSTMDCQSTSTKETELEDAKNKILELQKLLQIIHLAKDRTAKENEELKNKLSYSDKSEIIKQLSAEIQEKNIVVMQLSDKLKNAEESSEKVIKGLNTEIINLKSQLCFNINIQEDLENVRKQLMSSQASITGLQQANTVLTAQLLVEQEKVKELEELKSIKDDYFALQQQVDIYKADFDAERQAKELLKNEKEQIINDFLQIQKRNNELNEEIELIKERGYEVVGRRNLHSLNSSRSSVSSASSQEKRYTCPICNFGFTTYQALENHVDRCMDLSASLP
ncbi:hypothetical protein HHI36_001890 [Cryptolaemus montrouzieri]|uniref:Optineurin n=1 Tax=Cryptolaemus montrouzieri TaxID=559131 RepID=A0ABD2P9K0_9CUCU